ncbi:MAG: L,D-transpeptidase [Kiritimatiellae bacterium]|nr:L,D-transpeptidase [Kiritimatiellia bacterium]
MLASIIAFAAITFAESKSLLVQIELDRAGFSCNAVDGVWGAKSAHALERYLAAQGRGADAPATPEAAWRTLFRRAGNPYAWVEVTQEDIDSLTDIPQDPAEKARLPHMGYESIAEMFAERGHLSRRALERLNPGTDLSRASVGTKIRIPAFRSMEDDLDSWPRAPGAAGRAEAALVKVSLGRCEITAYDAKGRLLASFPCSIAKSKSKLPPCGELKVTTSVANPNYTYTPDAAPGERPQSRHILPAGPNCPVGVAWIGLSLPGYGIHGTPRPESIGNAESHGCFRLANWNAARLYSMVRPGVRVVIEE